jgi:Asp-tRNA(Asn)/Glu-tRNA(Gln) amidotransferase A subunit family amidase
VPGVDPAIDEAVDRVLAAAEVDVVPIDLPGWAGAGEIGGTILLAEAFANDARWLESELIGEDVRFLLGLGNGFSAEQVLGMRERQRGWQAEIAAAFGRVEAIATPTMKMFPPRVDAPPNVEMAEFALPVNAAGVPALALPVPTTGRLPTSVQLIGPHNGEERLLALGRVVEAALR